MKNNEKLDKTLLRLRYFGSGMLIGGYFTILYVDVLTGVAMTLVSDIICAPYAIRRRYWDIIMVISVFTVINVSKLITLLLL